MISEPNLMDMCSTLDTGKYLKINILFKHALEIYQKCTQYPYWEVSLKKFKRIEKIQDMFFDHNIIKLEIMI